MEHRLSAEQLYFSYERQKKNQKELLHDFSVDFAAGKMTALLGPNGSGKSTLIKLLSGVQRPTKGTIRLDGENVLDMKRQDVAKKIAVVHQKNSAPADYTVQKLVEAGRIPHHGLFGARDAQADAAAVEQALRDTDTAHLAERLLSELSGGQLQRVWLALALAQQTDILLLDELTTYLDVHYQLELLHLIRTLNQKRNKTIVMVLHDLNLALAFCDEAVVMRAGKIVAKGDIQTALTEEILNEAFQVETQMLMQGQKKYCVFQRKEECCG